MDEYKLKFTQNHSVIFEKKGTDFDGITSEFNNVIKKKYGGKQKCKQTTN